jgi:hypothetical protein
VEVEDRQRADHGRRSPSGDIPAFVRDHLFSACTAANVRRVSASIRCATSIRASTYTHSNTSHFTRPKGAAYTSIVDLFICYVILGKPKNTTTYVFRIKEVVAGTPRCGLNQRRLVLAASHGIQHDHQCTHLSKLLQESLICLERVSSYLYF